MIWKNKRYRNIEKRFEGVYIPTYFPKEKCWGVDTSHGVEIGDLSYVTDQFCWDSVIYHFHIGHDRTQSEHVHGSFELVIEALLNYPDTFSIEGFEDSYSTQERCVLMNIKESIRQVKKMGRPLTREEARANRKRIYGR